MANGIKEYDDQDTKYNPAEALSAGEQAALDQIEATSRMMDLLGWMKILATK